MKLKEPLLVVSLLSSGCSGINQYTQFSYSQQNNLSATKDESDKHGAEITHGISSEVGDHRIRLGLHYKALPDIVTKREIAIDPNDYLRDKDLPANSKYLFKEEIVSSTTGRSSYDFSASLERVMFRISPSYKNQDLEWLRLSGLLGAGFNLNLQTGKTNRRLGEYDIMDLPELKFSPATGFADLSLELKLGKKPFPIIPLKLGWRIFSDGEFYGNFGIGYEVQW